MSDDEIFLLYVFDHDGMHSGGVKVLAKDLKAIMDTIVSPAVKDGREVIMTDLGDHCVFHARDRKILHPTREDCAKVLQ